MRTNNTFINRFFSIVILLLSFVFTGCKDNPKKPIVVTKIDTTKIINDYDTAYVGIPLSDTIMQHNKETFVIYGCAYCHGLYLTPVGEAADLRKSTIVGADVNGNLIGKILLNGIPLTAKSSPMPQYSDLKDEEIKAISAYIHYARDIANKTLSDSMVLKK
jgi:Cytochrome C oxidase, cbb3-type, subunit III